MKKVLSFDIDQTLNVAKTPITDEIGDLLLGCSFLQYDDHFVFPPNKKRNVQWISLHGCFHQDVLHMRNPYYLIITK